jgi:hypothetical protein
LFWLLGGGNHLAIGRSKKMMSVPSESSSN